MPSPEDSARHLAETELVFAALEAVAEGVVLYDLGTGKVRINAAALALFGLDASFAELPRPERLALLQPRHADGTPWPVENTPLEQALRGETVREMVWQIRAADGRAVWLCASAAPVRLGGGSAGVVLTLHDVTEQHLAEEALRRSEAELRAIFETSPDFMVVKDRQGRVVRANAATCALIGLPLDQIVGRTTAELHGNPEIAANDQRIMASGQTEVLEEQATYGSRPALFLSTRMPYRDDAGTVIGVLAVSRDITEQKRAEASLRVSEERFRTLFENAAEAIVIVAAEGREAGTFLDVNAAAAATFGFTREEMRGMPFTRVVPPEGLAAVSELFPTMAERWVSSSHLRRRKDGTLFPFEITAGPLQLDGKRCVVSFGHDASARVRSEQELRSARDAAEAASRAKSAFLANMSHEVRTPMHTILGYVQILLDDPALDATQREQLGIVFRSGGQLLALLNDILDASRIGTGLQASERANLDLKALVDEAVRGHASRAAEKSLTLALDWSPSAPPHIVGDAKTLRRVLTSLLGNAIKFTERGSVVLVVAAHRREGDPAGERLTLAVRDTGAGLGAGDLDLLFRPFAQARVGIEAHGGTGLGLVLSRELAQLMGGTLTGSSRPGEGSTFTLEIPLERGQRSSAPQPPAPAAVAAVEGVVDDGAPKRILVVEDDEDSRILVSLLLRRVGFEVCEARDGIAGVEAFDAWHPHLVLLDMNMPVLDGYGVAHVIRVRAAGRATRLLALTASAQPDDHDRMVAAGIDQVLLKPCPGKDLLDAVRRQLALQSTHEREALTAGAAL